MAEEHTSATLALGGIGLVIGIISNIAYFQQGGYISVRSVLLYPVILGAIGAAIDSRRDKKKS